MQSCFIHYNTIETMYNDFMESGGMDILVDYIHALKERGKKYDTTVILFMDAFSAIQSSHSLINAICFGYSTIQTNFMFEIQVVNIARSIVECDQFDVLGENGDAKEALQCLMELKKNSTSLTEEDKNYLSLAIKRINGGGCKCSVM